MQTHEFEELVKKHSLKAGILYPAVALAGEVGEVCNNLKKVVMVRTLPKHKDYVTGPPPLIEEPELRHRVIDELGDALFYLVKIALDNDTTLRLLMKNQEAKLEEQSYQYQRTFLK